MDSCRFALGITRSFPHYLVPRAGSSISDLQIRLWNELFPSTLSSKSSGPSTNWQQTFLWWAKKWEHFMDRSGRQAQEMMEASVVIPTKNGASSIGDCLEAVYSQEGTGRLEVVMVDSGSTDRTLEIARKYPVRVEEIPADEFHHARTRNFAASLATGEYLVFLSQDAIPANCGWLKAMLQNFEDG